jgi:arabinofuranan 3-O-arabinosyltransferase
MAFYQLSPARGAAAGTALPHLVGSVCFALIVSHVVFLLASLVKGDWLIGHDGGVASDFVNVWAAGKLALGGHAASAYDWATHKAAEESAVGHSFDGYFGWHYPPTFLFVAIPLSLLPYAVAYVVWVFGTFPAYLAAIRAIIGDRIAYLLAAAFPAVLANFVVGQNGFLSAGLIGGTLVLLERRALLAGVLLGLLTYKPHLGLLFPIALIAGWHWRAFVTAAIVATLMAAASWAAFGADAWRAFAAGLGKSSQAFLSDGWADFGKLQTAFGLTRSLGGSETLAWSVQAGVVVLAATAIAVLWRSRSSYEIKAAALGTGAMLATPYLYMYDVVVLAVPLAYLIRLGRSRGFLPHELSAMGFVCLLILIFPFVKAPVGFAAVLIVAGLIARRVLTPQHEAPLSLAPENAAP